MQVFLQLFFVVFAKHFCSSFLLFLQEDFLFHSRLNFFGVDIQDVFLCSQKQDLPGEKMRGRIFQRDLQRLDFWEQKELKNTYQRKCCFPQ